MILGIILTGAMEYQYRLVGHQAGMGLGILSGIGLGTMILGWIHITGHLRAHHGTVIVVIGVHLIMDGETHMATTVGEAPIIMDSMTDYTTVTLIALIMTPAREDK